MRDVCSCKGEPAPTLALDKLERPEEALEPVKGDLVVGIEVGSVIGERPDKFMLSWPSGLEVGAMISEMLSVPASM
jgi:F0F1-type ATP synthase assembly protein I